MRLKDEKGFTLMEMLIVVTIIAVLASIVLPRLVKSSGSANKSAHRAERHTINSQIELWRFHAGVAPADMTEAGWTNATPAVSWTDYWPDGVPATCNQGVNWAIDATTKRISLTGHEDHE